MCDIKRILPPYTQLQVVIRPLAIGSHLQSLWIKHTNPEKKRKTLPKTHKL